MIRLNFAVLCLVLNFVNVASASAIDRFDQDEKTEIDESRYSVNGPGSFLNTSEDRFTVVLNRAMVAKPMSFSELNQIHVGRCFAYNNSNRAKAGAIGGFELKEESAGPLFGSQKFLVTMVDSRAMAYDEMTKDEIYKMLYAVKDVHTIKSVNPVVTEYIYYDDRFLIRFYKDAQYKYTVVRMPQDYRSHTRDGQTESLKANDPYLACYFFLTK